MRSQQSSWYHGKTLLLATLLMLLLVAPASAVVITTAPQTESDLDRNGLLDPFQFSFTGLAAPDAGDDSLQLHVEFSLLDLGRHTEVLGVTVTTDAGTYEVGSLNQTITGGNLASNNANGFGELEILFSAIGDFEGGDLDLLLTTNSRIQAYHTGSTFRCTTNCEGSATATLSYATASALAPTLLASPALSEQPLAFQEEPDGIPLPGTLALLGLGMLGAGLVRSKRPAGKPATTS